MIPYELTLHNFMCYRGTLPPLLFDGLHVACLSGENGAGKSSLLDAMTWALWGKARMSDDDLIAQGESEMLVDFTFLLNQQRYRVIRRRQRGKTTRSGRTSAGKSSVDFQVYDEHKGWRSLSESGINETNQAIQQVLRMRYETFINASFLLQGRADEFTRKTPGERKQVLADMLDLGEYAALEERARKRVGHLKEHLQALDGALEVLQTQAEKQPLYEQMSSEAEARVATLTAALESARQQQQQADEQVRHLHARAQRQQEQQQRLASQQADQQQQQTELADLRQQIAQDTALLAREAEISAGVAALNAARDELARLEGLRPRYEELRDQARQCQDQMKDERRRLLSEQERYQAEAQRLAAELDERPALERAVQELAQQLADLEPLAAQVQALGEQRASLDERLSRGNTLLLDYTRHDQAIKQRLDSLVGVREEAGRTLARLKRQLRDQARWQSHLDTARQQQHIAGDLAAHLADLRQRNQTATEQVGKLRAERDQASTQADDVKRRQEFLAQEASSTCPLCGSDLGEDGTATIHEHYDKELAELRQRWRDTEKQARSEEHNAEALRQQIEQVEQQLQQAEKQAARIPSLEEQLAHAAEWQQEMEQAQTTLEDVTRQIEGESYAPDERAARQQTTAELASLLADNGHAPGEPDWSAAIKRLDKQRKTLDKQRASLEKQLERRTELQSQLATRQHQLATLTTTAARLPEVQQQAAAIAATIEQGDFAADLRQHEQAIQHDLAALGYTPDQHEAARIQAHALHHWAEDERRLEQARNQIASNQRMLERLNELAERRASEIAALQQEIAALKEELQALPGAEQQARDSAARVQRQTSELQAATSDMYEKQHHLKQAQQAAADCAAKQQERQTVATRHNLFQELVEAFGKKGIQAMLIETAIPEIEREANRLLSRITHNQMHLSFEMQRTTRSGTTSETLEIKIADGLGTRTYDAFSGGEAMRINFAIRVALSRLLAGRAGASLETLIIDEGFGALDAEGRERFVDAITSVQQDFKRILVITHLDELKDRFPARIEITKATEGSTWALL